MDWLIDKQECKRNIHVSETLSFNLELMSGIYEFKWKKQTGYSTGVSCSVSYVDPPVSCLWKVTLRATITVTAVKTHIPIGDEPPLSKSFDVVLCYKNHCNSLCFWPEKSLEPFLNSEKRLSVQVSVHVLESHGLQYQCSHSEISVERLKKSLDGVLLVKDKQIAVNKALLSFYSPFFDALFNSDFKEKKDGIFNLQDAEYNGIVCLMKVLFGFQQIKLYNYEYLLELSDKFQILKVKTLCEAFIVEDKDNYFTSTQEYCAETLKMADQYSLTKVQDMVIASIESLDDLKELSDSCYFEQMSSTSQAFVMKCCLDKLAKK